MFGSRFRAITRRMRVVATTGIELSLFPSSAYRQIEIQVFAEAEVHSAGAKTKRPAYQDGGLPRTERATFWSGAGLGYHF